MGNKFFDDKKIEASKEYDCKAGAAPLDFCEDIMTALSLQLVSTSQIQQKAAVSPTDLPTGLISAGWNTDLYDKNSFNNQKFDSAVFLRSSNFKRHPKYGLH